MLTRREFIKLIGTITAAGTLGNTLLPHIAGAFTGKPKPPVIWLELLTCTGNFLSFANTYAPNMQQFLLETVDLHYSNTMMAAEGEMALEELYRVAAEKKGEFILLAEGTVPTKAKGRMGIIGYRKGEPVTDLEAIKHFAPLAKYVVAVGSCASFGGPFAARPNPSGSKPVSEVVDVPVINVPGCPAHPDWIMGTLTHLLLYGPPDLDAHQRPLLFFGRNIHDWCPRRRHFDNGEFAEHPGEEKCVYKIGCKGPVTFSDCPTREWISLHTNWPVEANTPCIGCVNPEFPDGNSPFFEHLPDIVVPGVRKKIKTVAKAAGVLTAGGIAVHLGSQIVSGRLGKNWVHGTVPRKEGSLNPSPSVVKEVQKNQEAERKSESQDNHKSHHKD